MNFIEKNISKLKGFYNYQDEAKVILGYILSMPLFITLEVESDNLMLDAASCFGALFSSSLVLSTVTGSNEDFKDIKKIRKLYELVLNNYDKLQTKLDIKTFYEMQNLFIYAYQHGYLSKNHQFKYELDSASLVNINPLYGSNIISGHGQNLHSAFMLHDLFRLKKIDSMLLAVDLFAGDEENLKQFFQDSSFKRSNHLVNFVLEDNKAYFLDTSSFLTYQKQDCEHLSSLEESSIPIDFKTTVLLNDVSFEKIKQKLTLTYENSENLDFQTKLNNSMIDESLEKFYLENADTYEEISSRLALIRKKM